MLLSLHFSLAEFIRSDSANRLGNPNTPTPAHLQNLKVLAVGMEKVRALLGFAIKITSGYRNPVVNKSVGGVPNSDHALGFAADFQCPAFGSPYAIALKIQRSGLKFDQLIHERKPDGSWWVHISFHPRMRQQSRTFNGKNYTVGITPVTF